MVVNNLVLGIKNRCNGGLSTMNPQLAHHPRLPIIPPLLFGLRSDRASAKRCSTSFKPARVDVVSCSVHCDDGRDTFHDNHYDAGGAHWLWLRSLVVPLR